VVVVVGAGAVVVAFVDVDVDVDVDAGVAAPAAAASAVACVVAWVVAVDALVAGRSVLIAWPRLIGAVAVAAVVPAFVPSIALFRSANGMCRLRDACRAERN
jgi:hypothetical protein